MARATQGASLGLAVAVAATAKGAAVAARAARGVLPREGVGTADTARGEVQGPIEVLSVVSRADWQAAPSRSNLLTEFPLDLLVLAPNRTLPGWNNLLKLAVLHEYVSRLPPNRLVLALDFFDVVWMGCSRDLAETFRKFGRPLVFGAEVEPYPLTNASLRRLPGGYPVLPGRHHGDGAVGKRLGFIRKRIFPRDPADVVRRQPYRYLNAGCIAGYAGALQQATGRMIANQFSNSYVLDTPLAASEKERESMLVGHDDQVAWHAYALRHPEEIALDYYAELFLNVYGFDYTDFELRRGEVWARPFGRSLCLAHGNGASNTAFFLRELQLLGIQPWSCRHAVYVEKHGSENTVDCSQGFVVTALSGAARGPGEAL